MIPKQVVGHRGPIGPNVENLDILCREPNHKTEKFETWNINIYNQDESKGTKKKFFGPPLGGSLTHKDLNLAIFGCFGAMVKS